MSTYVSDTFTDTSGTALVSHTPTLGTAWGLVWGNDAAKISSAGRVWFDVATSTISGYVITDTIPVADYAVQVDVWNMDSNAILGGIFIRHDGTYNGDAVRCYFDTRITTWTLDHIIGGSSTSLGTFSEPGFGNPDSRTLRVEASGTTINVYINGTLRITGTTSISIAGKAGVLHFANTSSSDTTGTHLDNFSAQSLTAASAVDDDVGLQTSLLWRPAPPTWITTVFT